MAGKITQLAELSTSPAAVDFIEIVDVSDTSMAASGTNKKLQFENLFTAPAISGGTINGAVIGGAAPAAGTFTALTVSGSNVLTLPSTANFRPITGGTWRVFQDFHNLNGAVLNFELETISGQSLFATGRNGTGVSTLLGIGAQDTAYAPDVLLFRDNANTLALRNGANGQTFRIYNTFTDASNYERGILTWSGNNLILGAQAAGSGTQRSVALDGADLSFQTAGSNRWILQGDGQLLPAAHNAYDIGNAESSVRDVFTVGRVGLGSFDQSALPPTTPAGMMIFVIDEAGGAVPAFSDGSNWRRCTDRAIVS